MAGGGLFAYDDALRQRVHNATRQAVIALRFQEGGSLVSTRQHFPLYDVNDEHDACGVGFVANTRGVRSHEPLREALFALSNLAHRGAVDADRKTGDGAGVMFQVPEPFFRREYERLSATPCGARRVAVGVFFLPDSGTRAYPAAKRMIEATLHERGMMSFVWRHVPCATALLGSKARQTMPDIEQLILLVDPWLEAAAVERQLYVLRRQLESRALAQGHAIAIASLSSRTIVYKGLMIAPILADFYTDLRDTSFETAFAVFHQRYSTNTLPRWSLAQPFRFLAHNGEINTLQGNVNFMQAREPRLTSRVWGEDVRDLVPIIEEGASDSGALDNALELLTLSGRDLPHALMMLMPQAYENDPGTDDRLKGFYDYHGTLMEPWDGPAAVAMSDGRFALAGLDRNGLRPQRYWLTSDDLLVVASETGVLPLEGARVVERGRLGPGRLIAVDTLEGRLLRDEELKGRYAGRRPYREWVERYEVTLDDVQAAVPDLSGDELRLAQRVFGYGSEDYDRIFEPMALDGLAPIGSMGDDTPLAVLSSQPQLTYRYFKQRFAQVTNPPMDPLREQVVMSLATVLGPRASVLDEEPEAARVARFPGPVIDESGLAALLSQTVLATQVIDCSFPVDGGGRALARALEDLADRAQDAVESGVSVLVLSDRGFGQDRAPVPMLLAVGAVHHRLLLVGRRTRAAIVCDTGEPREDHHFACLVGYGAALVHPYLALATARDVAKGVKGREPKDPDAAVRDYVAAVEKGLLKVMSKMGISTMASYRGAQVFEHVGLSDSVIERYFHGTPGFPGGADLAVLARDALTFHAEAFTAQNEKLVDRGLYRFRKAGEYHALNPDVFKALHRAVRTGSVEAFEEYSRAVDDRPPVSVRDLLEVRPSRRPVPLDEVEPAVDIVRRFTTQAMSHGSVSREAASIAHPRPVAPPPIITTSHASSERSMASIIASRVIVRLRGIK